MKYISVPSKFGLLICSLLMHVSITTAQEISTTDSKLNEVTIYSYGANMKHTTSSNTIPSGISELVINQVARQLNPESIRIVSSNKDVKIQSVSFERDYISSANNKSSSYLSLKEEYEKAKELLSTKTTERLSEESILSLLEANKNFGGNNGITPTSMTNMMTYYKREYKKLLNTIILLKEEETKQKKIVDNLAKQLTEAGGENANAGQLVLTLYSDKAVKTDFEIEYYTQNVSWSPSYEIRVDNLNEPVDLTYNANLAQQTGIDWQQIPLRFSSGQPHTNNNIPQLDTWWISYMPEYNAPPAPPILMQSSLKRGYTNSVLEESMDTARVEESQLQTSFVIATPYDVYTNKKSIAIELKQYELPAEYTYYSIPSKQKAAFLVAKISDWEKYNLLPGEAQLVIDGQYAGKSHINPRTTLDTLQISLGRDDRIITSHKRIDEEGSKTSFLGNTQKRKYVYEIELRNTRSQTANIEVKELFPVSTEKDIVIKLDQTSGAKIADEKGELTWHLDLKPNETKKLIISYTISYPKGKDISGL